MSEQESARYDYELPGGPTSDTETGPIIETVQNKPANLSNLAYPKVIYQSDVCRVIQIETGEYEVSHILRNRAGIIQEPKDEDFGVWAWTAYDWDKAVKIKDLIESGGRPIRSMEAQQ